MPSSTFTFRTHFGPQAICALVVLTGLAYSTNGHSQTYAPWLAQIGITNTVESAANWGKGQLLGVVDTGINATHPQFAAGQVSQVLSACAAVTFRCSNGAADDNGHGTAVASIAAGNRTSQFSTISGGGYTTVAGNFIGVAPAANIFAEKVLNAAGSGYSNDVANGIRKAADGGATVINVSITYGGDAATVAAINYAASKGAFVVWAGGNSAANLLNNNNTSGLTASAIQHLIFAGSVNSNNVASSFTNKPGSGSLVSTTNTKTAYSTRWIMAPGEAIVAPATTYGNTAYMLWSGTSMAAPVISGSLMLLQNAWPVLKTRGTTADLLLATSTDLGAAGVDAIYGKGLANLTKAFTPYGSLTVTNTTGKTLTVSSLTGTMLSSGALGSLSTIKSLLATYTAFDGYARNFSVNLSGLIKTPSSPASLNPLPTNTYSGPKVIKYAGGEMAFALESDGGAAQHLGELGYDAERAQPQLNGYSLFASNEGTVSAMGYGGPVAYSFARTLFNDDMIARQMSDFSAGSTQGLAQGGYQFGYGVQWNSDLRIAANYAATPQTTMMMQDAPQRSQYRVGMAYRVGADVTAGLTYGNLIEQNGFLGASYRSGSPLAFGDHVTSVIGVSLAYRLDRDASLLFNGEFGRTEGGQGSATGLINHISTLQSRAWNISYLQQNLWAKGDQLVASIRQPLRVSSGNAVITTASTDAQGEAVYQRTSASLAPDGHETDFVLNYSLPTSKQSSLTLQAAYQKDALNISGNHQSQLGLLWNTRF